MKEKKQRQKKQCLNNNMNNFTNDHFNTQLLVIFGFT